MRVQFKGMPCMAIRKRDGFDYSSGHFKRSLSSQLTAARKQKHPHGDKDSDVVNSYITIYVMLPLGVISLEGGIGDILKNHLETLKSIRVDGVMVDCWWGIVQAALRQYNWRRYIGRLNQFRGLKANHNERP
ncbi:hypothetical protein CQW23_22396 [Capsicum baccatum]|uniref:Beta-amylase n=1 Tax=Capsicum baccatum TaxID=33114 RepID=A0A2G2W0U5_CAPBA|nr:hypothetical protein CQW23_22396 [Capsicum baccatum]